MEHLPRWGSYKVLIGRIEVNRSTVILVTPVLAVRPLVTPGRKNRSEVLRKLFRRDELVRFFESKFKDFVNFSLKIFREYFQSINQV